jgi:NAD(P)-dependent dehydrogenase (short-subunit alcohol dehydrogenase family)
MRTASACRRSDAVQLEHALRQPHDAQGAQGQRHRGAAPRDYAGRLWDYWERNLDPDLFIDKSLEGNVRGKVVVITGGGSGIGLATAQRLAGAGAKVVIAGRTLDKLGGGSSRSRRRAAMPHATGRPGRPGGLRRFIDQVIADHGRVDILINNAGRSIRRAIEHSYDRFHDFERTMQINYFSPLRCPARAAGHERAPRGHIINISSMGVLGPPAALLGLHREKSALEGFTRCAETEYADRNVHFTNINMPLVRTPMIARPRPTTTRPRSRPEEAADMWSTPWSTSTRRVATDMGR